LPDVTSKSSGYGIDNVCMADLLVVSQGETA
jgi:hypothetical protein